MESSIKEYFCQADSAEKDSIAQIKSVNTLTELEQLRVNFLGKNGIVTGLLKLISTLPVSVRQEFGSHVNLIKKNISSHVSDRKNSLELELYNKEIAKQKIDVTLPGRGVKYGNRHVITSVMSEVQNIFIELGFDIVVGPEIETDFYNFTALNISELHPARAMHDTFYFKQDNLLLRTHTSPAQIHTMEENSAPLRIISPGRVYRCDSDQTHSPMFHQLEALVVDVDVSFVEMKSMIYYFFKKFFTSDIEIRFRPSYFPFTEPSAEVDIRMENSEKWLEVMGCGMVHPNVLTNVNIDHNIYSGYAFGVGIDRLAMLKHGISDLRLFFDNDIDFLEQF